MNTKAFLSAVAIMAVDLPCAASAAVSARATTALDIHAGPGAHYAMVGVIPEHTRARVRDCIRDSGWCQISFHGIQGWSYSSYLTASALPWSIELAQTRRAALSIPTVSYQVNATEPVAETETVGSAPMSEETVGSAPTEIEVTPPEQVEPPLGRNATTSPTWRRAIWSFVCNALPFGSFQTQEGGAPYGSNWFRSRALEVSHTARERLTYFVDEFAG